MSRWVIICCGRRSSQPASPSEGFLFGRGAPHLGWLVGGGWILAFSSELGAWSFEGFVENRVYNMGGI